jgi:hypothetical protein
VPAAWTPGEPLPAELHHFGALRATVAWAAVAEGCARLALGRGDASPGALPEHVTDILVVSAKLLMRSSW